MNQCKYIIDQISVVICQKQYRLNGNKKCQNVPDMQNSADLIN